MFYGGKRSLIAHGTRMGLRIFEDSFSLGCKFWTIRFPFETTHFRIGDHAEQESTGKSSTILIAATGDKFIVFDLVSNDARERFEEAPPIAAKEKSSRAPD
jgi:hypothetical protein